MPRGPQGQRRSADTNANAVHVMKLATGGTVWRTVYS